MKLTDKFEKCAGIYIFTNLVNGKQYVGETLNMKARMDKHRFEKMQAIDVAIKKYGVKKYGVNNFDVYIEYFSAFRKIDLLDLEEQLIIKFDSLAPNGYNICRRGQEQTGLPVSKSTREKISKANSGENNSFYGKKHSEETKRKISNINLGNKYNVGRIHSEEARTNMSRAAKAKRPPCEEARKKISDSRRNSRAVKLSMKPIVQIDKTTGYQIKIWPSASDASEFFYV